MHFYNSKFNRLYTTIICILLTITTYGQSEDYKKIELALTNADINTLLEYAPEINYGNVQFSTPNFKMKELNKTELNEELKTYYQDLSDFKYEQLFNDELNHLPFIVGKFVYNKKTEYVMIGMADFGGSFKYLSFQIVNQLPPNMKTLDKK